MKLFANAVLAKELRSRMRIWKTPALLVVYLLLLGLIGWGIIAIMSLSSPRFMEPESGLYLYTALAMFQLGLITLIAPALTVAQVSGERDRQTFDLLLTTRMTNFGIIAGKFGAALAFMLLMIIASVPIYSLVFLFGGVSLKHLGLTFLLFVAVTLVYGAIGLTASVLFRRTQGAVVASYALVLFFLAGTFLAQALWFGLTPEQAPPPGQLPPPRIPYFYFMNPLIALASALPGPAAEMIGGLFGMYYRIQPYPPSLPFPGGPGGPAAPSLPPVVQFFVDTPPWIIFLLFSALFFVLLMTVSVVFLSPVKPWMRRRLRRQAGPGAAATAGASGTSGS